MNSVKENTIERAAEIFRDWYNNYLWVERFAEDYGLTLENAEKLIAVGRVADNQGF